MCCRIEQHFLMESRHIYSISESCLTVTNYCSEVFSNLMMMLVHQMHHRHQVPQVATPLVKTDVNSDKKNSQTSYLTTSLLSRSQFASWPEQKTTVRSVIVLLTFKTRHIILEGCMHRLMTITMLGINSIKMKRNNLQKRLLLLNNL